MPAVYILICIVSGVLLGVLLRRRQRLIAWIDHAALVAVLVLVWLLGAAMGANEQVTKNLGALGAQAAVISVAAMVGSIALVEIVHRVWFRENGA